MGKSNLSNMVKGAGVAGLISPPANNPATVEANNPDTQQSSNPAVAKETMQPKSYRIPAELARTFKKWAIDQHMTEQEAVALAMVRLMENYHAE